MNLTLAVDADNDLFLTPTGDLAFAVDAEAVAQSSVQAARTLRGELVLDVTLGIPYFDTVWTGVPNIRQFEAALRQRLLAVRDVRGIVSLSTAHNGSVLSYVATLSTTFGSVTING